MDDSYPEFAGGCCSIACDVQDGAVMGHASTLKVITQAGVGDNPVRVTAATQRGIEVCNTPDAPTLRMAKHALGWIFAVTTDRQVALADLRLGSNLIKTDHGGRVDLGALKAVRKSGHLAGVGLHVTRSEPLAADDALLRRDDVVVTLRIAAATKQVRRLIFRSALAQAIDVLKGQCPPHLLNPGRSTAVAFI